MRSVVLFAGLLAACGSEPAPASQPVPERAPLQIAAAASLTDVLPGIAARFEERHHRAAELRFGASSTLARQIHDGAPTDAFVSADPRWIADLIVGDVARADGRVTFATNRLVVIVPAESDAAIGDLGALVPLPHLALAGPEVPAGAHARRALTASGVLEAVEPHVVSAPDVRGALAWVAQGEAEAGIVYATDARVEPRVRVALEIPTSTSDPILYEAITIADDPDATAFVAFLTSPEARAALEAAGFGPAS